MTKYARIDDETVVELFETSEDIKQLFHPEIVWVKANSSTKVGQKYISGAFSEVSDQTTLMSRVDLESLRLIAYAHPVTGSDRYFSESVALQAEGFAASSAEVKEAKAKGLARKAEIQTLYPYPAE